MDRRHCDAEGCRRSAREEEMDRIGWVTLVRDGPEIIGREDTAREVHACCWEHSIVVAMQEVLKQRQYQAFGPRSHSDGPHSLRTNGLIEAYLSEYRKGLARPTTEAPESPQESL